MKDYRKLKPLTKCEICCAKMYYQPEINNFPNDMYSWEVYANLNQAKKDRPTVKNWSVYYNNEIENPIFLDCPYRHEGELSDTPRNGKEKVITKRKVRGK